MEEGTVETWKKSVGDSVEKGELIIEIATDKATVEVESNISGTLQEILVEAGKTVPVGEPLAVIAEAGE